MFRKKSIIVGTCALMTFVQPTVTYALTPSNHLTYVTSSHQQYISSQLNELEKQVYSQLNDPTLWLNGKQVTIDSPNNMNKDQLFDQISATKINSALSAEAAKIFFVDFSILAWDVVEEGNQNKIIIIPFGEGHQNTFYNKSYHGDDQEKVKNDYETFLIKLEKVANEIKESVPIQNPYFLSLGINQWLIDHNIYSSDQALGTMDNRRSAFSALMSENDADNGPVCVGYGYGFKAIADELGLNSVTINGQIIKENQKIQHFWNRVQMSDGLWYDVDSTWNDAPGSQNNPQERFFMVGSQTDTFVNKLTPAIYKDNHIAIEKNFNYPSLADDRYLETKPTAMVNNQAYYDLQEAINASSDGQTVRLFLDVNLSNTLSISDNKNIILDLNGHQIQKSGYVISIENGSTLTLKDRTVHSKSDLASTKGMIFQNTGSYVAPIYNEGNFIIESGKIVAKISDNFVSGNNYTIPNDSQKSSLSNSTVLLVVPFIQPQSVSLDQTNLSMHVGEQVQLHATISPSNADDQTLTWTSTHDDIVTVDEQGNISALQAGEADIIVKTSNQKKAVCHIQVVASTQHNKWLTNLTIEDWTYGETPRTPQASAQFGNVQFIYSQYLDQDYTSQVPTEAGTWYVKAFVDGTQDYEGLVSDPVSFSIHKKVVGEKDIDVPHSLSGTATQLLSSVSLSKWYWDNPDQILTTKISKYNAYYEPEDLKNYDYSQIAGYKDGRIIRELSVDVQRQIVEQIDLPSKLTGTVKDKLQTIQLPEQWSWDNPNEIIDMQKKTYLAVYTPDETDLDYHKIEGYNQGKIYKDLTVDIQKIIVQDIEIPQNISGKAGEALSTIDLPQGWSWDNPDTILTNENQQYRAIYTPTDTDLYDYSKVEGYQNGTIIRMIDVLIEKKQNQWLNQLKIDSWEYGQKPNTPSIDALYGQENIRFEYSQYPDKEFTSTVPTDAGNWYVKAIIDKTNQYTGLESQPQAFTISKKKITEIELPDQLSGIVNASLSSVVLPTGWVWENPDQILTSQQSQYTAIFTQLDEKNYDYTAIDGYVSSIIKKELTVTVSKHQNTWIEEPTISSYTYGETVLPTGSSQYGYIEWSYSQSVDGPFTSTQPTQAGKWYVKAHVNGTYDYTSLDKIIPFEIKKAIPQYSLPETINVEVGTTLHEISLPKGFSWLNNEEKVAYGQQYQALYTPQDTHNYENVVVTIPLNIHKKQNQWLIQPNILSTAYGSSLQIEGYSLSGTPYFLYSSSKDGKYTHEKPTKAGTWYAIAVIDENDMYDRLESQPFSFEIQPLSLNQIDIDENMNLSYMGTVLINNVDYTYHKEDLGNQYKVTISLQGNYTGTIIKYVDKEPTQETLPIKPETQNPSITENNDNQTSSSQNKPTQTEVKNEVQTNDSQPILLFVSLALLSFLSFSLIRRRKEK